VATAFVLQYCAGGGVGVPGPIGGKRTNSPKICIVAVSPGASEKDPCHNHEPD